MCQLAININLNFIFLQSMPAGSPYAPKSASLKKGLNEVKRRSQPIAETSRSGMYNK